MSGTQFMIGGTVQEIMVRAMGCEAPNDGKGRQERDQLYSYGIVTDKGEGEVEFRNSSNGYYGGDLELYDRPEPERVLYGYLGEPNRYEKVKMVVVTKDYLG